MKAEEIGISSDNHKTGFRVWINGRSYWHRTVGGANKRVNEAFNKALIVDVKTDKVISRG